MADALIFNIQKFSLNDGPGIRTVVFFKGCPLHCRWCSNPESQSGEVQILWDSSRCLHCGSCEKSCPAQAIRLSGSAVLVDETRCRRCLTCVQCCPGKALKAEGERRTVEETLAVCLQDKDFYEESGGGVTFSGGEMLLQTDFVCELADRLHENGVSVAAETTGYCTPEEFRRVLPKLDYLLYDLKHWDDKMHRKGTGVSLLPILNNLHIAVEQNKEVLPRIPVIPGYNDSLTDAQGFCHRLQEVGISRVQLLPFHQFGEKKYAMLNREYALTDLPPLHPEDLEQFRTAFVENGIEAFF